MWQHIKLSVQIRPWDTLACCWDVKQPTNEQTTKLLNQLCRVWGVGSHSVGIHWWYSLAGRYRTGLSECNDGNLSSFRFLRLLCPPSKICLTTYSRNWISGVLVGFGLLLLGVRSLHDQGRSGDEWRRLLQLLLAAVEFGRQGSADRPHVFSYGFVKGASL